MKHKNRSIIIGLVAIASLVLSACATPAPVEKVVTQLVKETVKETVIVEGTPQVVEKEVTKLVEKEVTKLVERVVTATPVSKVGGTWTISIVEEPETLDLQKSAMALTAAIWRYLGDPLIAKDLEGNYVPGLATSWEASEDGLTWTFTLREGVTFHDGTPLDAAAVVQTFERALDPETNSPIAGSLLGPVESIEVTGDMSFALTLNEPFAPFLENLTDSGRLSALSPAAIEAAGDDIGRQPVSTGPWMFKEWVTADHITLVRNPDYNWGSEFVHQGPVYIEELVFRVIPEPATAMAAFEAGELSQLSLPASDVQRILDSRQYEMFYYLRKGVGLFMEFNVTAAPFDDITVRKALNYAVDKQTIVDVALEGLGEATYGPLAASLRGYWDGIDDYAPHYDPAKAAELLDEAGWVLNEGTGVREKDGEPLSFVLYNAPIATWESAAQLIQAQLKEVGVKMDIQVFEFGTLLEKLKAGEQQAHLMGYTYATPDIVYLWFHSSNIGSGLTLSHYSNPELDQLIVDSRTVTDWPKRAEIYKDIQKMIVDEALWVPIFTQYYYIAIQSNAADANVHPDGYMILNDAYLTQ